MVRGFGILLLAGSIAACASLPPPVPKAGPEQVRLIDPALGQEPDIGYQIIGQVHALGARDTPIAELTRRLRSEGAALGADAVILERIRRMTPEEAARTREGEPEAREGTEGLAALAEMTELGIVAEGIAIYYPGPGRRH